MKKIAIAVLCLVLGSAAMTTVLEVSRANAEPSVLVAQAPAVDGGVKLIDPPPSGALDAGSASAPAAAPSAAAPAPTMAAAPPLAAAPEPDVSTVQKLWRSGALLGAGVVAVFLLLTIALKVDPTRAFYYSAGTAVLGTVVDTVMLTGSSPNASMLIVSLSMFIGIIAKGPQLARAKT